MNTVTTHLEAIPALDKPQAFQAQEGLRSETCNRVARVCVDQLGSRLRAVILTGSLARGEATFLRQGGRWRVLGDAEFLVVVRERDVSNDTTAADAIKQQAREQLLRAGIECSVSVNIVRPNYFSNLKPHIFAYELRMFGQIVWGDSAILSLIPSFAPDDIPLEDAWQLLTNRMIELIESGCARPPGQDEISAETEYRMLKLYLDMATSFVLFEGAYEPTYLGRAARLRDLAGRMSGEKSTPPFSLSDFADRVSLCTKLKMRMPVDGRADATDELSGLFSFDEVASFAHRLWRWELIRLTGAAGDLTDHQLIRGWSNLQPVWKRLRGWAYVLRRCGWHRSWRWWPRWLRQGLQASPRYCVYAAASQLFCRLPALLATGSQPAKSECKALRSWLPVVSKPAPGESGWRQLALDIAWNFHQFLEETRA